MTDIKDCHIVLFFTEGVALRTWDKIGSIERESALYRALSSHVRKVSFVTYGGAAERHYRTQLDGISIVSNWGSLPLSIYRALLTRGYPLLLRAPTIVRSNQMVGADTALEAARRSGSKFIARCGYLRSLFTENLHGESSAKAQEARALENKVFTGADHSVVTTAVDRDVVLERYPVPPEQVSVIPNYVETDRFRPSETGAKADGAAPRICFVGRLEEQKNLFALMEAVRGLDVDLDIVGRGRFGDELRQKAEAGGIRARFMGSVPHGQLSDIINAADVFVLPSHYEGHPKALIEAMACGAAVLGTEVVGIREVIAHRETGYLCGTSAEEIRAGLEALLDDDALRARMGRNARDYVVEHFALERIVDKELSLMRKLFES